MNLVKKIREQGHLENLVSDEKVQPFGICFVNGPQIIDFPGAIPEI